MDANTIRLVCAAIAALILGVIIVRRKHAAK